MVSTSYPLEVKIPPPLCGNCGKLRAELEAKDKRIAELEEHIAMVERNNVWLNGKYAELEQCIADAPHDEKCLYLLRGLECNCWKATDR